MGTRKTNSENRRRLRKKLLAQGWSVEEVDRRLALVAARQREERAAARELPADVPMRRGGLHRGEDPQDYVRWYRAHRAGRPGDRERVEQETYERLSPDDSRHRPAAADPLLTGSARVSAITAAAARRAKAMTRFEWQQQQEAQ